MSMTVEALAQEILRCSYSTSKGSFALAERLLPFIERHIAAGQQGAGDDDVLEMLCRLERLAVVHRVNGSSEWKLLVEQAADMIRRLATPQQPKPAGAVPLPEAVEVKADSLSGAVRAGDWAIATTPWSTRVCDARYAKGWNAAREAAARGDHAHAGGWQGLLDQVLRDTAKELGCEPDNEAILEAIHALKDVGRADAVPVGVAEYLRDEGLLDQGESDCISAIRAVVDDRIRLAKQVAALHSTGAPAPQPMTTQGEAVYLVQHKDTTVKSNWTELTKDSYEGGCFPDELFRRRELYTGSQP